MPVFAGDWVLTDGENGQEGKWIPKEEWLDSIGVRSIYPKLREPTTPAPYKPKYEYKPTVWMPYEGIDAQRFPNTYVTMIMLHCQPDWHTIGKWVNNGYRDFIRDPYKKE